MDNQTGTSYTREIYIFEEIDIWSLCELHKVGYTFVNKSPLWKKNTIATNKIYLVKQSGADPDLEGVQWG